MKTKKTGGTSLEIALSKFLGSDDIATPISPEDEKIRASKGYPGPRNYRKSMMDLSPRDLVRTIRDRDIPRKFYNHIPSVEIRRRIGEEIWNKYYKFCVERNPWDLAVSYYYMSGHKRFENFAEYVEKGGADRASNYELYCIDGVPVLDRIILYEELSHDLDGLSKRLGLPESLSVVMRDIHAKGGFRKKRDYRELYDERLMKLIAIQFAREIAMFGFTYGG